ncbi:MAG: VOC family protein [Anaerolineae bacterium]
MGRAKVGWPGDYWLVRTGPEERRGIDGALKRREEAFGNVVNTVAVESLDAVVDRVAVAGGNVLLGKAMVPGVGALAYCQDTEGNVFCVLEPDPSMNG